MKMNDSALKLDKAHQYRTVIDKLKRKKRQG